MGLSTQRIRLLCKCAVAQGEKMQGMVKVCLCCCMEFSETPLSLGQIASPEKIQHLGAESTGAS